MFNHKIIRSPLGITRILGKITIQIEATDATSGVKEIKIFIDDEEKTTLTSEPYEWTWNEKTTGKHTIKIVVKDEAENQKTVLRYVKVTNLFGNKGTSEDITNNEYNQSHKSSTTIKSREIGDKCRISIKKIQSAKSLHKDN